MVQTLRLKVYRLTGAGRKLASLKVTGWIQIVTEIEAQGTDRSFVAQSQANRMRSVIVPAVVEPGHAWSIWYSAGQQALCRVGLVPARKALEQIVTGGEDIAHIVKNSESEASSKIRQTHRGKAQFLTIHEKRSTADGKTGIGVARPCLV